MCNPRKGFDRCKPNRKVSARAPQSFDEFVDRFIGHQLIHGVVTCKQCKGSANCTEATLHDDDVLGTFVCNTCQAERKMLVTYQMLRVAYDNLLRESQ